MNRWWPLLLLWIAAHCSAETLSHGRFQDLPIYRPRGEVERVVLFLSGEQGWSAQLSRSAQLLASQGALVAGIDSRALLADLERAAADCVFPDGDLENLSHFMQAYYRLPSYEPAVLVGHGAGATLSYAMLAQAPADTFAGAEKERSALAPAKLEAPWIAVQTRGGACGKAIAQRFVSAAPGSEMVLLPRDANSANWEAAVSAAVRRLDPQPRSRQATPEELAGLPIIEIPAKQPGTTLAILISGDGGWAGIDKAVSASLAEQGIAVVGVDSLRYFWKERTPQSTAADVDRIVRHYLEAWNKKDAVLIGYSQGADVMPFVVNRLPAQTRERVRMVAMLGLSERAVFEFHLANWLPGSDPSGDDPSGDDASGDDKGLAITPELRRMSGIRALCVYSDDEDESSCPEAASDTLRAVSLPGGHHFGGDYDRVAALILEQLR